MINERVTELTGLYESESDNGRLDSRPHSPFSERCSPFVGLNSFANRVQRPVVRTDIGHKGGKGLRYSGSVGRS